MSEKSPLITLQFIADLINLQSNSSSLSEQIGSGLIDWDEVVKVASHHLLLPTLFSSLEAKNLLSSIPEDLHAYLEEITGINKNRNTILLQEAKEISTLLREHHIEHVFIKGIALLVSDVFSEHKERMVGDIDILVNTIQIDKAYKLLYEVGYTPVAEAPQYQLEIGKHLPRQASQQKLGAVELHKEVLKKQYVHYLPKAYILKNARIVNNLPIPEITHSLEIGILQFQTNDKGHLHVALSFKHIYDYLSLVQHSTSFDFKTILSNKYIKSFFAVSSIFFPELSTKLSIGYRVRKNYFIFRLHHKRTSKVIYRIVSNLSKNSYRVRLFLDNRSYRIFVLQRIMRK